MPKMTMHFRIMALPRTMGDRMMVGYNPTLVYRDALDRAYQDKSLLQRAPCQRKDLSCWPACWIAC